MNNREGTCLIIFIIGYTFLIWGLLSIGIQGEYNSKNSAFSTGVFIIIVAFAMKYVWDWRAKK